MQIETKFKVNDLIQHKFQRNGEAEGMANFYEVIEIITITCSAGTQNFYKVRPIVGIVDKDYNGGKIKKRLVDFGTGHLNGEAKYIEYREDEIVAIAEWIAKELSKTEPNAQVSDTTGSEESSQR